MSTGESCLRSFTNQKVKDVYEENVRFDQLLKQYYSDRSKFNKNLQELWIICYRCACNVLKKKYGFIQSVDWIEEKALEVSRIILTRIQNDKKFPNGYVIKNLPTCVSYAVLNAVYGCNNQRNISLEEQITETSTETVENRLNEVSLRYYNMYGGWEDELLDRLESEGY